VSTELRSPWPDNDLERLVAATAADPSRGGEVYAELHHAHRTFQDRLSGAALTDASELACRITAALNGFSEELAAHQVSEGNRWDGWRTDLPGRGHPLLPPYVVDEEGPSTLSGRVTFGRYYLGGNGAAHGGSQPLLFDDMLGRLVNRGRNGVARTAYLKVNYRQVTPLGVELHVWLQIDREEGRKRWCTGTLSTADGVVVADVEALFLALLPGQP